MSWIYGKKVRCPETERAPLVIGEVKWYGEENDIFFATMKVRGVGEI